MMHRFLLMVKQFLGTGLRHIEMSRCESLFFEAIAGQCSYTGCKRGYQLYLHVALEKSDDVFSFRKSHY
jgi:hypothetical protein